MIILHILSRFCHSVVMGKWKYKIKEFTTWHRNGKRKDGWPCELITFEDFKRTETRGIFGKKTKEKRTDLTVQEMETTFNELGAEGFELCGVIPLTITSNVGAGSNTDRAYFIFKKPIKD
ncbi:MAG: hypothetical protein HYY60_00315 [Parcubacteria group bacterium]|nr:hypothetical protein [Parcubacteria group bacterium]